MSLNLHPVGIAASLATLLSFVPSVSAAEPSTDHSIAFAAQADPLYAAQALHAIRLPGLAEDFVFPAGGEFFRSSDGTARLTGVIRSESDPDLCFALDLALGFPSQPVDAGDPPTGSPRLELADSAYAWNGGPIDPSAWTYFQGAIGTLHGLEGSSGAVLTVTGNDFPFQLGLGANGANLQRGASGGIHVETVQQPAQGPLLPSSLSGDVHIALGTNSIRCATAAVGNQQYVTTPAGHALAYTGVGSDFIFQAGGQLVEYDNGTADFHGVLTRKSDPAKVFAIDLNFSSRINPGNAGYPPAGSPKKELAPSAYIENGGPVDASTWYYYTVGTGKLTGYGDYDGAKISLVRTGPSFQIGVGANGKNLHLGGSGWFDATVLQQPTSGPSLPQNAVADVNIDLDRDCFFCVDRAEALVGFGTNGGHAFALPGIGSGKFVFLAPGQYVETAAGTAQLSGELVDVSDPNKKFNLKVEFATRVDPGHAGYPPAGSPNLELAPAAYVQNGGPIDPSTWHYFLNTDGVLHGLGAYQGAILALQRAGPAFQVGVGANGKNFEFGASGWLAITTLVQPNNGPGLPATLQGDINIDLRNECLFCPTKADTDPIFGVLPGGHVLYLPGIGPSPHYVLESVGRYIEYDIGTARLRGVVRNALDLNKRFQFTFGFSDRVNPGEPGYPPPGSPHKQLQPFAYLENGGPIDTGTWHYFLQTGGFMIGLGDYAGAQYHVQRLGPAFQVGVGASGMNLDYGASGWLDLQIFTQPTVGPPLPASVAGDLNINLFRDCPP